MNPMIEEICGAGMRSRRLKADASLQNASKLTYFRQRFAGDDEIDQDDLFHPGK